MADMIAEKPKKEALLMSKLENLIRREMDRCIGEDGSQLSTARERLKGMYLGVGYKADEERSELGLSTYVDRTVMQTVEWCKPGLMRIFTGDEIIRFDPKVPEQEQAAEDATTYVNTVIFGRNIFRLVHDTLTDGLYQRAGWALAQAETVTDTEVRELKGVTEEEAIAIVAASPNPEAVQIAITEPDPLLGARFDVSVRLETQRNEITVTSVPPEHVIISGDAEDVEHARFIAMWDIKTRSDLLKEGYDAELIDELPKWSGGEMPETRMGRRVNDEDTDDGGQGDGAHTEYKIYDAWLDWDEDGDGIAEKVRVTFAGGSGAVKVLRVEAWPLYRAPLFAACSVPLPHQAVGMCIADLVDDIQTLKTDMTRQYLDGLAYANSGELVVKEGPMSSVDYDSLLSRAPGRIHRVSNDVEIFPMPSAPVAQEALQGVQMADLEAEKRTGISARTTSISADALQNTATGAAIQEEAVNQRLELVARVYAEDFFKPLGRYVLHLLHRYQDKAMQVRVKGRFLSLDPRNWDPDMNISVAVGLGTGNRSRLVGTYQTVLNLQQAFMQQLGPNSPVRLSNIVYTCHKMAEAAGLEAPERFFGSEEDARQAEQAMMQSQGQRAPSPEEMKVQAQIQKGQAEMAMKAEQMKQTAALQAQKSQAEIQAMREKAALQAQVEREKAQAQMQLLREKQEAQAALKAQELEREFELDRTRLMMGETTPGLTELRGA